ncbi:hypothetical protein [Ructibacterium gallinarum]|uniref:Uncharacterized protein n=1 Tax=Ructibacterium gallinarum TaxID=2779355 RepID=A0A9D5M0Y6_9FIRM|nr:hypothetical protein [Ructibacterium gallinarum]MBE5039428.1 hypothetical protein [Ructibacterium gallinarum]
MIQFQEVTYQNFGRCVSMSNGKIELLATLDFGPRIIRFSKIGGENVMLEDIERKVNQDQNTSLFAEKFGEDLGVWKIYGGHRLWTSPEALPRSYYPDSQPVSYTAEGCRLVLTPPPQRWTQQQHQIEVVMSENGFKVDLYHTVTNIGAWPQEFAPWCLSVLAPGGIEVIPMPNRPTGLLHNRKITLWDYAKMNDPRVTWGDKYILLRQDPQNDNAFKFGIDSQHGWAAYFNHDDVMLKKFDIIEGAAYPDDGMNFETYTNSIFLEMESLGALKKTEPGCSISHHESWELIAGLAFPGTDENAIETVLRPYVG